MEKTQLNLLIDKAAAIAGSDYKLAQNLGVPRQHLSNWRTGVRACPIGEIVLMADIAGLQPDEWLAREIANKHEGTRKGERLTEALKKAWPAIGEALATSGKSALMLTVCLEAGKELLETMYIMLS